MKELNVKKVIISWQGEESDNYKEFKEIVKQKRIKIMAVKNADTIFVEKNINIDVLWPDKLNLVNENVLNNNSIVCKLKYNNFSMLSTGDIEKIAEEQILQEYKNNLNILKSTILKVAHHGSKTSTTIPFLEAVSPKIALIGVGENNKFGHPNVETLDKLNKNRN